MFSYGLMLLCLREWHFAGSESEESYFSPLCSAADWLRIICWLFPWCVASTSAAWSGDALTFQQHLDLISLLVVEVGIYHSRAAEQGGMLRKADARKKGGGAEEGQCKLLT